MPFYLTNENIEATMERNPDDTFNPLEINTNQSMRTTSVSGVISQVVIKNFENITKSPVCSSGFSKVDSFNCENFLSYSLKFETDVEEYELAYHVPSSLVTFLSYDNQNKSTAIKEVFFKLSQCVIMALNEEYFSFLQDIEFVDFSTQIVDIDKKFINLYALLLVIDKQEYTLYLELDNIFNKIF